MASVLFCLPKMTYDLPADNLLSGSAPQAFTIKSADPSGKLSAGKSYVIFGKQDNTDAINLSAIAAGTSTDGFVINGESAGDYSAHSVSSCLRMIYRLDRLS
jgi:NAD(P)H-hydrate repair Nnr-like enzyme with NAD(P)H-hydrate dehydratase domain